jgi:predicted nucleic acid-binding protein
MKYVIDASVAVKCVLPEKDSPRAVRLLNAYRKAIHELIAPDIFPIEIAHALTRAERRKIIQPPQGAKRFAALMRIRPLLRPYLPLLPRAFAISSAMSVGVYDCVYVALAEQESCEMVTADTRLVNALQKAFPFIVSLASMP